MAAGYRDINTTKTVVAALQEWPAKAGGLSPKGPAVAGITVVVIFFDPENRGHSKKIREVHHENIRYPRL